MIVGLLFLSALFVLTILTILMLGVLTRTFVRNKREGIGLLFLFFGVLLLRVFANIYFAFFTPQKIIFTKLNILFDAVPIIAFLFVYRRLRYDLFESFVRVIDLCVAVLLITDVIFFFYYSWFFGALNLLSLVLFVIFSYLAVIKLLSEGQWGS